VFDKRSFQRVGCPGRARPAERRGQTIAVGVARAAAEQAVIEALTCYGLEPSRNCALPCLVLRRDNTRRDRGAQGGSPLRTRCLADRLPVPRREV